MDSAVPEIIPIQKRKNTKRKEEVLKNIEKEEKDVVDAPDGPTKDDDGPTKDTDCPTTDTDRSTKDTDRSTKEEPAQEPPTKKIRITAHDAQEEPSILRGAFIKPLLLAGIASASFFVNNYYKTTAPAALPKKNNFEKKNAPQSSSFLFQSASHRQSIIPGFTI